VNPSGVGAGPSQEAIDRNRAVTEFQTLAGEIEDRVARGDFRAAIEQISQFRTRHAAALAQSEDLYTEMNDLRNSVRSAAEALCRDRAENVADLRARGEFREAYAMLRRAPPAGFADLDQGVAKLRADVQTTGGRHYRKEAERLQKARQFPEAVAAYRVALEFIDEEKEILALNHEIERMKRGLKEVVRGQLESLVRLVANRRLAYPAELQKLEGDPNAAELIPFLRSVRDDLARFAGGAAIPKELHTTWLEHLEETPLTLGDRRGIPGAEQCPACSGSGLSTCRTCGGSGTGYGPCATCQGKGKATCSRCGGSEKVKCEKCHGKGRVMVQSTRTCPKCGGGGAMTTCTMCNRTGRVPYDDFKECPGCRGSKRVDCRQCRGTGTATCDDCDGEKQRTGPCANCDGTKSGACLKCKGSGRNALVR